MKHHNPILNAAEEVMKYDKAVVREELDDMLMWDTHRDAEQARHWVLATVRATVHRIRESLHGASLIKDDELLVRADIEELLDEIENANK